MQNSSIIFGANVKTTPAGVVKGNYKCTVMPQGIHFQQGKNPPFMIPVGTPAWHVKENKLALKLPDYQMELTITCWGSYSHRLTRDLVMFLNGQVGMPYREAYRMPWWLTALALLPAGIPVLTLGGGLPAGFAAALVGVNLMLAQKEEWSMPLRLGLLAAVSAAGYGVLFAILASMGLWPPHR
jgi:hypothetical protein